MYTFSVLSPCVVIGGLTGISRGIGGRCAVNEPFSSSRTSIHHGGGEVMALMAALHFGGQDYRVGCISRTARAELRSSCYRTLT